MLHHVEDVQINTHITLSVKNHILSQKWLEVRTVARADLHNFW